MFERVDFYAYIEYELTVDRVQVENSFTFATVVAPEDGRLDTKLKPKRTVPFKTFLVPMPFPLVTTFETDGTYKKCLWPNSAYITLRGMRYYYGTRTSIHIPHQLKFVHP